MGKKFREIPYVFSVEFYGPLSKTTDPNLGHTRVRAFYRGRNRNGSYITDEFASYLVSDAEKKPVVGFYNRMKEDFEGHVSQELSKAYGYIPSAAENNFAWEQHLDEDGVTREYACFDVVLWVDYWPEASQILAKAQSMELNPDTITGTWEDIDGETLFVYSAGRMKGFCVLGDGVEPCFEGSAFFSADRTPNFEQFSTLLVELEARAKKAQRIKEKGGENTMLKFKVAGIDHPHYMDAFMAVNPNFTEEKDYTIDSFVFGIDDANFSVLNIGDNTFSTNTWTIDTTETGSTFSYTANGSFPVLFNNMKDEAEYNELLEKFEALTAEHDALKESNEQLVADFEAAKAAAEQTKTTFEATTADLQQKLVEANDTIAIYSEQIKNAELEKKNSLIETYEKVLEKEEITEFSAKLADFSYDELEAKLAVAFSRKSFKDENSGARVPTVRTDSELKKFMEQYKK